MTFQTANQPPHISTKRERKSQRVDVAASTRPRSLPLERFHRLNIRQEVLEKVLDSVPEGRRRGGTAGTGALHLEIDDSLAIALEDDVAAVASDRRADSGLDQFLDRLDRFGVLGVEELAGRYGVGAD